MKYFVALVVATVTLAIPTTPALASAAPADYRPECEQGYQALKPVLDPLIGSPLKALFGPMEAGFCNEQKHVPE
jgi:hypothetical protein